jgi:DNA-directed RNA polymerase specialized sigma24 family protein
VIVLRFYEDLTEKQTAAAMECSVGNVKSQTHAALKRLRDRLGDHIELTLTRGVS